MKVTEHVLHDTNGESQTLYLVGFLYSKSAVHLNDDFTSVDIVGTQAVSNNTKQLLSIETIGFLRVMTDSTKIFMKYKDGDYEVDSFDSMLVRFKDFNGKVIFRLKDRQGKPISFESNWITNKTFLTHVIKKEIHSFEIDMVTNDGVVIYKDTFTDNDLVSGNI